MNLAKFPRRRYTAYETPIEFLPNFTKALGGPTFTLSEMTCWKVLAAVTKPASWSS